MLSYTIRLPTTWLPVWPVASVYTENTVFNVHTFSPGFILLTAGLQVVMRDAETAPEELLFELRKPPEHGVLLKDTAEFPGPMAPGSCSLCHQGFLVLQSVLCVSDKKSAVVWDKL